MTKRKPGTSYRKALIEDLRGNDKAQLAFIRSSFEENDDMPAAILSAIRAVAEARGFTGFAAQVKLNRENLYRVLSRTGNPRLDTFCKILDGLGLRLSVEAKSKVG